MVLKNPLSELKRSFRHIQDIVVGQMAPAVLGREVPKTNPKDELMWSVELESHPFEEGRLDVVVTGRFEIPRELATSMCYRAKLFQSDPAEFWSLSSFFPGIYYAGGLAGASQSDSAGTAIN